MLPFTPPSKPDKRFYRGNFCGVRVPGLALLPGMSGYTVPPWNQNQPPFCPPFMAQDIPRYDDAGRRQILAVHQAAGYTHIQCSAGHAVEQGMTIPQWIAYCQLVQSMGFYCDWWFLGGGPWNTRDMDANYWRPIVQPWIDAGLAAGVIDCACVGWQLDAYNTGQERMIDGRMQSPIQTIISYFSSQLVPHDIPLGTHWINEAGAWNDPFDRRKWYDDNRGIYEFFHQQGNTAMSIPEYQSHLVDTLSLPQFYLNGFKMTIYECSAQAQFDLQVGEDEGDQRGYLLCCTNAASNVAGYGNGARMPDGSVL